MFRAPSPQVVLVLVGLFFSAAIYPVAGTLLHPGAPTDTGDDMMMGIYLMGIFSLLSVRNPAEHRSFLLFTAWANIAHAIVMTILGFEIPAERTGFLAGSAVLAVISIVLLVLLPPKITSESLGGVGETNLTATPQQPTS